MRRASDPGRAALWAGVVLAVVGASLAAVPSSAVADEGTGGNFSDDDGSVHEVALDGLASLGVLAGMECGEGLICPNEPLKRWEMAVWLVRVLDGTDPAPMDASRFTDIDAERWWAPFVDRLYALRVTTGCAAELGGFCPQRDVTRAEMATFLKRAFDLELAPPAGFTDVSGGFHAANIDALAAAAITGGCGGDPLRYCPADSVTRGEMASFLARALDLIPRPSLEWFTTIDAGWWHSCGRRVDSSIDCWGSDTFGQSEVPRGQFKTIAGGAHHSCGLRLDGTVVCWGRNDVGQANSPTGHFTSLSAGWGHSCGLRTDGSVDCWGVNWNGRADPPDGQFSAVAVGDEQSCGLRADGSITCWGRSHEGRVPAGEFIAIDVGRVHSCGVRVDGAIDCWGANWAGQADPPQGSFSAVSVGFGHSCGVRVDGGIACWGTNWLGQADAPPGNYVAVAAGENHSCALTAAGVAVCWGGESIHHTGALAGQYTSIDAGLLHLCGVRVDGSLACTGGNASGQLSVPDGEFTEVAASDWFTCGLRTDGTASCWGADAHGETLVPRERFSAIAAGYLHSCGLRTDGTVTCWGDQPDAPDGYFRAVTVSVGGWHSCGLRSDGAIMCWGSNSQGQTDAPAGSFEAVAAGAEFSCGLRTDGTVTCWGDNSRGQVDAPAGTFKDLATGTHHSCAVGTEGTVVCWGDDHYGQSIAPPGRFQEVTADREYSCGLRIDGTVTCWGLARVVHPPSDVVTDTESTLFDPGECRPRGTRGGTTAGFPLPRSALPSTGTLRVAVLFVDFPDAAARYSTRHEAELGLPFIERFLNASSYGRLRVELIPHHGWLRAEHDHVHYLHGSSVQSQAVQLGIAEEAVALADSDFDFAGVDALMVVHPRSHFAGGSTAGERIETQEGTVQTLFVNNFRVDGTHAGQPWGAVGAHELLHLLGLTDLYPYDVTRHEAPQDAGDETWALTDFGPMGLRAYGPAGRGGYFGAREMLAWSRWQLGWLDDPQVQCVAEQEATVVLSPIADPGDGIAMAAVPLSDTQVIVIESRRSTGYDSGGQLLAEGVLVYTVNASISSGLLPVKLAGDPGNAHFDDYPLLAVGESVTVRGYTVTVVADGGDTHTVTITRTADG